MKKHCKRFLGMLLAIMLCLSFIPMSAFATSGNAGTEAIGQPAEPQNGEPSSELPPDPIKDGLPTPATVGAPVASPTSPPAALSPVEPELLKVVDRPLVQVVYHYFDDAQGQAVMDFVEYAVESSHRFYAIGMANGNSITIAANKYPGIVPVSTDALRFRVLNGSEDITAVAAYDAASGLVSLPYGYMGHEITVEWYCPASEITEVPVTATVCIGENGKFTTTTIDQQLASNANSIILPLTASDGLVVSQNGIDLPESMYSVVDGTLTISAPALGGDVVVSAYVPTRNGGFMLFSTAITQVNHTRSADQIYYGYYTSYYTANGNTAFCLDPNASGLNAGTYPVSRFLQRGSDNTLIKCAYYLYGGPGWNAHKNIMFQSPDTMTAYGLCHAAAAYVYLNDDSAFRGISSTTKGQLQNLIAYGAKPICGGEDGNANVGNGCQRHSCAIRKNCYIWGGGLKTACQNSSKQYSNIRTFLCRFLNS